MKKNLTFLTLFLYERSFHKKFFWKLCHWEFIWRSLKIKNFRFQKSFLYESSIPHKVVLSTISMGVQEKDKKRKKTEFSKNIFHKKDRVCINVFATKRNFVRLFVSANINYYFFAFACVFNLIFSILFFVKS